MRFWQSVTCVTLDHAKMEAFADQALVSSMNVVVLQVSMAPSVNTGLMHAMEIHAIMEALARSLKLEDMRKFSL